MDAQTFGQWLGVTMIAVVFGYIGYQILVRPYLWIRGAIVRSRRAAAFGEIVGELAKPELQTRNLTVGGVSIREAQLVTSSPPCQQLHPLSRRGSHLIVQRSRQGGKTEELHRELDRLADDGHTVFLNGRPYMTMKGAVELATAAARSRGAELERMEDRALRTRYSTPPEAMLLGFSGGRNGEIAVGARLDFERQIMDGDNPSSIEPRGIFGG